MAGRTENKRPIALALAALMALQTIAVFAGGAAAEPDGEENPNSNPPEAPISAPPDFRLQLAVNDPPGLNETAILRIIVLPEVGPAGTLDVKARINATDGLEISDSPVPTQTNRGQDVVLRASVTRNSTTTQAVTVAATVTDQETGVSQSKSRDGYFHILENGTSEFHQDQLPHNGYALPVVQISDHSEPPYVSPNATLPEPVPGAGMPMPPDWGSGSQDEPTDSQSTDSESTTESGSLSTMSSSFPAETSPAQPNDDSGNNRDLTLASGAYRSGPEQKFGDGYGLDGFSDYLYSSDTDFQITGDLSIFIAFEIDSLSSTTQLLARGTSGENLEDNYNFRLLLQSSTQKISYFHEYGAGLNYEVFCSSCSIGAGFHTLTLVRDVSARSVLVKVDQTTVISATWSIGEDPAGGSGSGQTMTLGAGVNGGSELDGGIYEFRMWNQAVGQSTLDSVADPTSTAYARSPVGNEFGLYYLATLDTGGGGGGSTGGLTDDFNDGTIDTSKWTVVGGAENGDCGAVSSPYALKFDGSTRSATTVSLDTSSGGTIDFSIFLGTGSSPCENVDAADDVVLEYSTDGGSSWTTIATYDESTYTSWTSVSENIPTGAQTSSTIFRWSQPQFSGSTYDHWAIDDVDISASGGSDTFVVRACWHYQDENGVDSHPQRWAGYIVREENDGDFDETLEDGTLGENGCFQSAPLSRYESGSNPRDIFVKIVLCTDRSCVTDYDAVAEHKAGAAYTYFWDVRTVDESQDVMDFGTGIPPAGSGAPSRIFQYLNHAHQFSVNHDLVTKNLLGMAVYPCNIYGECEPEDSFYALPEANIAGFTAQQDTIWVGSAHGKHPDVIAHEYGHFIMDKLYNDEFWPTGDPYVDHFFCEDGQDLAIAWQEGFANWIGVRIHWEVAFPEVGQDYKDRQHSRDGHGTAGFDLELRVPDSGNFDTCGSSPPDGDDNEGNIAMALWDLTDTTNDGIDKGYHTLETITDLLSTCKNQHNFEELYNAATTGTCNWNAFYDRCDFLTSSHNNRIKGLDRPADQNPYENTAPTISMGSLSPSGWISSSTTVTAWGIAGDAEGCEQTTTTFRASKDTSCSTADPLVDTDGGLGTVSGSFATWDSSKFPHGDSIYVCGQADDDIDAGAFSRTSSSFLVDRKWPTGDVNPTASGRLGEWNVYWSASDQGSGLGGTLRIHERVDDGSWSVVCSQSMSGWSKSGTCARDSLVPGEYCYKIEVRDKVWHTYTSPGTRGSSDCISPYEL